jgi:hypothetical protein
MMDSLLWKIIKIILPLICIYAFEQALALLLLLIIPTTLLDAAAIAFVLAPSLLVAAVAYFWIRDNRSTRAAYAILAGSLWLALHTGTLAFLLG